MWVKQLLLADEAVLCRKTAEDTSEVAFAVVLRKPTYKYLYYTINNFQNLKGQSNDCDGIRIEMDVTYAYNDGLSEWLLGLRLERLLHLHHVALTARDDHTDDTRAFADRPERLHQSVREVRRLVTDGAHDGQHRVLEVAAHLGFDRVLERLVRELLVLVERGAQVRVAVRREQLAELPLVRPPARYSHTID